MDNLIEQALLSHIADTDLQAVKRLPDGRLKFTISFNPTGKTYDYRYDVLTHKLIITEKGL